MDFILLAILVSMSNLSDGRVCWKRRDQSTLPHMNQVFGQYDITRELGRGAMGVVYLATHRSLQRECALKTISLKFKDPNAAERFIHEGQAVARLGKHSNIVQVFDAGIVDKVPYIAMEFVAGETLDQRLVERGPFAEADLIELGSKIALALDHAHRRGIVHRDVKLANVIIDQQGEPQLLDFGISKDLRTVGSFHRSPPAIVSVGGQGAIGNAALDSVNEATLIVKHDPAKQQQNEAIQGTPAFMAPEQPDPRRGPIDARSDVYSLGATLYVLATEHRPFEARTLTELLVRVVTDPPVPPSEFVEISPDLEAVILKSFEKDPAARYQTALEYADDLSRVTMGLPTRARKLGKLGWIWKRLKAHGRLVSIAAGFLIFAGILMAYVVYRSREIQALWSVIAERTARSTAQEVESLLEPALPMLEECRALAESGLLPVDDPDLLARHLVARFRYQKKLSWLTYGDAQGRFTGAWRHKSGRIVIQRSWLDDQGGHVREQFADGDQERLRWSDDWSYDPRTRPFYRLASEAMNPIWTKPYEWFGDEGLGITSAVAWRDADTQSVRGVFTADYHLGTLADFLANLKIGDQGHAYLLGRSGDLLASPDRDAIVPDDLLQAAFEKSKNAIVGGIQSMPLDEPQSFPLRHERLAYVAAVEAFQPAEGLPVVTFVLVPENDIIGPVKESAIRTAKIAGGIALLAVILSIIVSILQKWRLIKSLAQRKRNSQSDLTAASLQKTSIVFPVGPDKEPSGQ